VSRYRSEGTGLCISGNAAFANPDVDEFLEVERIGSAIRLPANRVLQEKIGYLLKRPDERLPHEERRYNASSSYQAQSWKKPRQVVAKVERHPDELYPRVGVIVTQLDAAGRACCGLLQRARHGGAMDQRRNVSDQVDMLVMPFLAANEVRLQLHGLAYNLGNFMRTLAMAKTAEPWSPTSLCEKLIKIGAKVVSHGRCITYQMAEIAEILSPIAQLWAPPAPA
jgi:hypothetical protein